MDSHKRSIPQRGAHSMAEGKLRTRIAHIDQPFIDEPFFTYPHATGAAVRQALRIHEDLKPVMLGHVRTELRWVKP